MVNRRDYTPMNGKPRLGDTVLIRDMYSDMTYRGRVEQEGCVGMDWCYVRYDSDMGVFSGFYCKIMDGLLTRVTRKEQQI